MEALVYEVTIYLSNEELSSLLYPSTWPLIRSAAEDQGWWKKRTECLLCCSLSKLEGTTWNRVYAYAVVHGAKFTPSAIDYAPDQLLVEVLLRAGVDPSENSGFILCRVVRARSVEIVKLLLADGRVKQHPVAINVAMCIALEHRFWDAAAALLSDRSIPIDTYGHTLLSRVVSLGEIEIVRTLITYPGVDINAGDGLALHTAQKHRYADIVTLLQNATLKAIA